MPIKTISLEQLKKAADQSSPKALILDVRTPEEFAAGHVPGAKNIPHDRVGEHAEELEQFETVYVYCRSGGRVRFAASDLARFGLTNLSCYVDGGMLDWMDAGYPVQKP